MIELETRQFAGIETLHATPAGQRAQPLPTVVFYHGFSSSKLVYSYFAVALAQAGIRVVMPDARDHGARFNGDATARLGQFWQILHSNLLEFDPLQRALYDAGLIKEARLAVGGASMGGMTALGAMARYPQIQSVACLMGSGYFMQLSQSLFPPLVADTPEQQAQFAARMAPLADYDPCNRLEALANRPLLLWHGEADEVVPWAESIRLERALRDNGLAQHLTSLSEKQIGHKITPSALTALVSFFKQQL